MGRIYEYIEINGDKFLALFDTGERSTYVTEKVARKLRTDDIGFEQKVLLGGKEHIVKKYCELKCKLQNLSIITLARVIDNIGKDEEGKDIDILIGAITMQEWGIVPVPEEEKIDMSHYPKEMVEF